MSQQVVEQIIGKMLLDQGFRKQVETNLVQALAGYDLTEDELQGFKKLDLSDFRETIKGLDERISKGSAFQ